MEQVNVHHLMEKMHSKKDVYNFLTLECEAYLPKLDTVNIYFLKQITSGKKEVIMIMHNFCSASNVQESKSLQCHRSMA